MVSSVRFRARQTASAPAMDKVKLFVVKHWQVLFLVLVGVVIVGTIMYKCRNQKPTQDFDVPALIVAIVGATLFYEKGKKTFDCLVNSGADVNAVDKEKKTPLHHAVIQCQNAKDPMYFIQQLLNKKARIEAKDNNGRTPLYYARDKKIIECLLSSGSKKVEMSTEVRVNLQRAKLLEEIRNQERSKAG